MLPQPSQRLTNDHRALDKLLKEFYAAVASDDIKAIDQKLDRFWARLAVHIRAEHLHVFPTILQRTADPASELSSAKTQSTIDDLREDHDFFMRGLAAAMITLRELSGIKDRTEIRGALKGVVKIVSDVEQRLRTHNEIEEQTIYQWLVTILSDEERVALARQIDQQLDNRPPRFDPSAW